MFSTITRIFITNLKLELNENIYLDCIQNIQFSLFKNGIFYVILNLQIYIL
jgi:hypothetical protein